MSTVLNFGCRLNACDSEAIGTMTAGRAGVIVNICAVTADAERSARAAIRRGTRQPPGVPITVTGCAATIDGSVRAAQLGRGVEVVVERGGQWPRPNFAPARLTGAFEVGVVARVRVRAATAAGLVA